MHGLFCPKEIRIRGFHDVVVKTTRK